MDLTVIAFTYSFCLTKKKKRKKKIGAEREAPWPRSLVAFAAEDPDPIPRTYLVGHNFL